jgi:hypothetical protein
VSREKRVTLLVLLITFLIVFEMIAYIATTPKQQAQYFQLYLLGANGTATDYYPNNNPNLLIAENVQWHITVQNSMGSVQLVEIRVKLGNQTIHAPDESNHPSSAPEIASFDQFLQNNETWNTPFYWSLSGALVSNNSTIITQMQIDNGTYNVNASSRDGVNFRIIIELWTFDENLNAFQYGWTAGSDHQAAWLQVWFDVTKGSIPTHQ